MLKRALRATIHGLRSWLAEEPKPEKTDFSKDEFLYPWLNSVFMKVIEGRLRRPDYAWGVLQGVNLAKALGNDRISVIEFGVAGGRSLLVLEEIAERLENMYGIGIDVYGFDRKTGIPKPRDHRDTPNLIVEGFFRMDEEKLRSRLKRARLYLGSLEETLPQFIATKPSPVAFVAVDVVLYSSTMQSLRLFDAHYSLLLPRVHCFFDDIFGFTLGDHNGERLAINDFNDSHTDRKISHIYGLKHFVPEAFFNSMWVEKYWLAHLFDHPQYGNYDGLVKRGTLNIDEWHVE